MPMVRMQNDIGGRVLVGKNELRFVFANGFEFCLRLSTKYLLKLIEDYGKPESEPVVWETAKCWVEPRYVDKSTGALLVVFTIFVSEDDDLDTVTVMQTDIWTALMEVECLDILPPCFAKFTPPLP